MTIEFRVERAPFASKEIELRARNGNRYLKQVEFEELEEKGVYIPPAFSMTPDDAQQLIDELWRCGLRPTEGSGSAGALAATQNHLEDMRTIALSPLVANRNESDT